MIGTAEHTHDWTCYGWKPWPGSPTGTRYLWRCDECRCLSGTFFQLPPGSPCGSTHGEAGYTLGSYWDGDVIVCGVCGARIGNPLPTGRAWVPEPGWRGWLLKQGRWIPRWPKWIGGTRGKPRSTR